MGQDAPDVHVRTQEKMKRLLILLAVLGCHAPVGPRTLPDVAGTWRFDAAVTDSGLTCRIEGTTLYLSQAPDSSNFSGQTKDGAYVCSDGITFPFPELYVQGTVGLNGVVIFDLVPYFHQTGQFTADTMAGQTTFSGSPATGRWMATRSTP
jgi:hypothetical protein